MTDTTYPKCVGMICIKITGHVVTKRRQHTIAHINNIAFRAARTVYAISWLMVASWVCKHVLALCMGALVLDASAGRFCQTRFGAIAMGRQPTSHR